MTPDRYGPARAGKPPFGGSAPWHIVLAAFLSLLCVPAMAAPSSLVPTWGENGSASLPAGRVVSWLFAKKDGTRVVLSANSSAIDEEGSHAYLMRLAPNGQVDTSFGSGSIELACPVVTDVTCRSRVAMDATERIVIVEATGDDLEPVQVRRYTPDGRPDSSFGTNGTVRIAASTYCGISPCTNDLASTLLVTALETGRSLVTVGCVTPTGYGTCLISLGTSGNVEWTRMLQDVYMSLPVSMAAGFPDGSVALLTLTQVAVETGFESVPTLLKMRADGQIDTTFGVNGRSIAPVDNFHSARQLSPMPDGGTVLMVATFANGWDTVIVRTTSSGQLLAPWGNAGLVRTGSVFDGYAFATTPAGEVVAVGTSASQSAVLRLDASGQPDSRFAAGGRTAYTFTGGSGARSVAIGPEGRVLIGGFTNSGTILRPPVKPSFPWLSIPVPIPLLFQIEGGSAIEPYAWAQQTAVEYYHAAFGHYFVTANGNEMQALDLAADHPWSRTGKHFNVWSQAATELSAVCRFWSDQSFAPKSSHFYTPYSNECATVRGAAVWTYEGQTFSLRLPQGVAGATTCPSGSTTLYRAYNNGMGGAPNHRYTIDQEVLSAMVQQGWTMEGDGVTRVFACAALAE